MASHDCCMDVAVSGVEGRKPVQGLALGSDEEMKPRGGWGGQPCVEAASRVPDIEADSRTSLSECEGSDRGMDGLGNARVGGCRRAWWRRRDSRIRVAAVLGCDQSRLPLPRPRAKRARSDSLDQRTTAGNAWNDGRIGWSPATMSRTVRWIWRRSLYRTSVVVARLDPTCDHERMTVISTVQ